jgi:nicotinic acid phosphoribosyltransferase
VLASPPRFSIPAAEHSTVTAWGRERERDAYRNFVEQYLGPGKYRTLLILSPMCPDLTL